MARTAIRCGYLESRVSIAPAAPRTLQTAPPGFAVAKWPQVNRPTCELDQPACGLIGGLLEMHLCRWLDQGDGPQAAAQPLRGA